VTYSGLFKLQKAEDLLGKLRHDFGRIESNRLDEYAAFDFFITAHHMKDWLKAYPRNAKRQQYEHQASSLLKVCSHLANGSKHFKANPKRHKSVEDTKHYEGQYDPEQFDLDQYDTDHLKVHLTDGSVVAVQVLARQVLEFWEGHPSLS
jgi:hypothetical protein